MLDRLIYQSLQSFEVMRFLATVRLGRTAALLVKAVYFLEHLGVFFGGGRVFSGAARVWMKYSLPYTRPPLKGVSHVSRDRRGGGGWDLGPRVCDSPAGKSSCLSL
jgi:hypothetical protein